MTNSYICNCKKIDYSKKNYNYWENRQITTDEQDIILYIKNNFNIFNKRVLHIGVGNSYLANEFKESKKIIGLTISQKEIINANKLNINNYEVFLCDKYSIDFKNLFKDYYFDFIIDINLKSYSCCKTSFYYMFNNFVELLNKEGRIITSMNGMNWYKNLKPKLSFNFNDFFHYKLKEIEGNSDNILTMSELSMLSKKNKLKISFNDKVCYLTK